MRWLPALVLVAGCSKLFGIEKIPYAGDAAPPDSPPDAPLVAKLQLGATAFDFGSIVEGKSSFGVAIQVTNVGDATTGALGFAKSGGGADDFMVTDDHGCIATTLGPGAACTFTIAFTPTSSGTRDAMLEVGDAVVTANATFTGVGLIPGALDMSPSPSDFGAHSVGSTDGTKMITLTNTGQSSLSLTSMAMTGDTGAFSFTPATGCTTGDALAGGATCMIAVTFKPALGGSHVASLQVTTDAQTAPLSSASLGGTGTATAMVTRRGNGTGSVASPGNEIACGGTCIATFATPMINLRGTADPLNAMTSWSGNCQPSNTASCSVSANAPTLAVDAFFTAYPHVTVSVTGTSGEVIGPNGLDCTNANGAGCTTQVPPNASIMLVPAPTGMSFFNVWGGDCTGTVGGAIPPCTLFTDADKTAVADFEAGNDYVINLVPSSGNVPDGSAVITGGISDCVDGDQCTFHYAVPTDVQLSAGSSFCVTFAAFSGDCSSIGFHKPCDVVMTPDQHAYNISYDYEQAPGNLCVK